MFWKDATVELPMTDRQMVVVTPEGYDIARFNRSPDRWINLRSVGVQVSRWYDITVTTDESWQYWPDGMPSSGQYQMLVWDVRIDKVRLVEVSGSTMTEIGSNRLYTIVHNMFYSHWKRIEYINPKQRLEIEQFVKEKGVRLGVDK